MMNQARSSYSANVTIVNYQNDDIEGPWELGWTWTDDELLLSTVGAKGTQHGNNVTFVSLPNVIIPSWFKEEDLAKSSSSFQISVGRVGMIYYMRGLAVSLTTERSKYKCLDAFMEVTNTPGYLYTWTTNCFSTTPKKSRGPREVS
ncbi:unnamed protein product [Microthlaspi erraticum]|uniref:Uncharacterized protein n=1 Tax=Microthlaspi erraticum TaxID=1685480 RepID=A0A6D2I191_9BRAS|nr:unnamed protein product [Microthlaspi erraticum]